MRRMIDGVVATSVKNLRSYYISGLSLRNLKASELRSLYNWYSNPRLDLVQEFARRNGLTVQRAYFYGKSYTDRVNYTILDGRTTLAECRTLRCVMQKIEEIATE